MKAEIINHWYILAVRGGREEKVIENIRKELEREKELKTYVRDLKIASDNNEKNVLKGYILFYGHLTPELVKFFYRIPRVVSFLDHQRKEGEKLPDFVSEQAISSFLVKMQNEPKSKGAGNHNSDLKIGDLVKITAGIFANYEGRINYIDQKKQKAKVVVESSGWEVTDVPLNDCQKILE